MSKHTPGPWHRFENGGDMLNGHCFGPQFADCVWRPEGPGHGLICDCSPHGQQATPETIANARLIAVAPDMAMLLEEAPCTCPESDTGIGLALIHLEENSDCFQNKAAKLIHQATGES